MNKPTCTRPHCDKPASARGLCARDYGIAYRAGTLPPWTEIKRYKHPRPDHWHQMANLDFDNRRGECSACGTTVDIFVRSDGSAGCIEQKRQAAKKRGWKKRSPGSILAGRRGTLKRKYGISLDDYERMLLEQSGKCAICLASPEETRLAVDHCHSSLQVRGLLCRKCNLALGYLRDDPTLADRVAQYLRQHRAASS